MLSQALADPGEHLYAAHILPEDDVRQEIALPIYRCKGGLRTGGSYSRNLHRIDVTLDNRAAHCVQRGFNELNRVLLRMAVWRIQGQRFPVILADNISLHIKYDATHATRSCINRREIIVHG